MCIWKIRETYPLIIIKYPPYLVYWENASLHSYVCEVSHIKALTCVVYASEEKLSKYWNKTLFHRGHFRKLSPVPWQNKNILAQYRQLTQNSKPMLEQKKWRKATYIMVNWLSIVCINSSFQYIPTPWLPCPFHFNQRTTGPVSLTWKLRIC